MNLESIEVNLGLFKDLTHIEFDKQEFAAYKLSHGIDGKLTLDFLVNKYPLVKDKVDEIIKSVNRGEMERRILADKESVLHKKPQGWAAFTSNFVPDIQSLHLKLEQRHEELKRAGYIGLKNGKAIYKSI